MRHIITGGSGFLGQCLAGELVRRQEAVLVFDLVPGALPLPFVQGDVTNAADLARLQLNSDDVVYHLAARQFAGPVPHRGRDAWFKQVNLTGTQCLVAEMERRGAGRLVFFSTDMTYGLPQKLPIAPDHPQNPLGPYGQSKLAAETVMREATRRGMRATIFRPRLITGPGRLGILAKLFGLIKAGLPVPMIGPGRNRYQMVSVQDCARAAILAVEQGCPPGPFNLGSEMPPTTRELLQAIIDHAGSRSILIPVSAVASKMALAVLDSIGLTLLFPEQYGIADADVLLDTSSTRRELQWQPQNSDIGEMILAYDAFRASQT
ncbi:MAG TPA: NAD(P)-dependent oxidoreductase [Rhizomicrobium sp.]|nr:NAD(P)-dependent oxidoreductase [Rhizomicrobium sp.]